ncbi:hypothetical protein [Pseudomonas sp. OHS18]|uniref:hypothetical protein n=1 Tax=Pseudomonas sp. OHS18 TaxID=3399679 RepID=UPI003A86B330
MLIFVLVLTSFLVVFFMRLAAALYIYIVGGGFEFSWIHNLILSARGGVSGGVVLGIGVWVMSKLEEKKKKQ